MSADGSLTAPEIEWLGRLQAAAGFDVQPLRLVASYYFGREGTQEQTEQWEKLLGVSALAIRDEAGVEGWSLTCNGSFNGAAEAVVTGLNVLERF